MKITISFRTEEVVIRPANRNGVDYILVEAAGINAKDILKALNEVVGKDAILEWASENSPKDADWHIRQQNMNFR